MRFDRFFVDYPAGVETQEEAEDCWRRGGGRMVRK